MNKLYKIMILLVFLVVGCNKANEPIIDESKNIEKFKTEYEALNDENINVTIDPKTSIIYKSSDEIVDILENKTGIIYFGFPSCPWCRNIIPVLLNTALENNMDVYYLDTHELRANSDDGYIQIMNILNDYLLANNNGEKVLYVPDVYFVKDGKIIGHHLGSVSSQTDPKIKLDERQISELNNIYQEFIDKIK